MSIHKENFRTKSLDRNELKLNDITSSNNSAKSNNFPSTRFYGSKRKQAEWLEEELRHIVGQTALDAFGGTGSVSYLLAKLGWKTTYNDIFEFNITSAKALFGNEHRNISKSELLNLLKSVSPHRGFISSTFHEIYFTQTENEWLDGFMEILSKSNIKAKNIILYCLFQACLKKRPFNLFHRANLKLRTSEIPVQFGNRTTWNKSFDSHIIEAYDELQKFKHLSDEIIEINSHSCAKKIKNKYDLIYLDPPYFKEKKRNTDTYLQRYHFLEGLARYDEWESLIDFKSPQKIIKAPYRHEWTKKDEMISNIREMIRDNENTKFVLSYVSGESPTEEELFDLFKENFQNVRLAKRSFNKALSKKESFEILLIGQ